MMKSEIIRDAIEIARGANSELPSDVGASTQLTSVGVDSLTTMYIINTLEHKYGVYQIGIDFHYSPYSTFNGIANATCRAIARRNATPMPPRKYTPAEVIATLREFGQYRDATAETPIFGYDDFERAQISNAMFARFGVILTDADISTARTIGGIAKIVATRAYQKSR